MAAMPNVGAAGSTFNDRLTLGTGADRIELYWFGAGHTDGDAFVVFPAERVMASGDIFQMLAMPRIDRNSGGSALALPDTLAQAQDAIAGVDKVIDGHGTTVHDWAAFRSYVAFTRALADAARKAEPNGGTAEQALAALEADAATRPFVDDAVLAGRPRPRARRPHRSVPGTARRAARPARAAAGSGQPASRRASRPGRPAARPRRGRG